MRAAASLSFVSCDLSMKMPISSARMMSCVKERVAGSDVVEMRVPLPRHSPPADHDLPPLDGYARLHGRQRRGRADPRRQRRPRRVVMLRPSSRMNRACRLDTVCPASAMPT